MSIATLISLQKNPQALVTHRQWWQEYTACSYRSLTLLLHSVNRWGFVGFGWWWKPTFIFGHISRPWIVNLNITLEYSISKDSQVKWEGGWHVGVAGYVLGLNGSSAPRFKSLRIIARFKYIWHAWLKWLIIVFQFRFLLIFRHLWETPFLPWLRTERVTDHRLMVNC